MKKSGFTLAEVLITLGIIGIVAAITIPVLMQSFQKEATLQRAKKVYTIFSQLNLAIIKDSGSYVSLGTAYSLNDLNTVYTTYISPNMKIVEDCGNTAGKCWPNSPSKYLWGSTTIDLSTRTDSRYFVLSDGTSIVAYLGSSGDLQIWFDIDGPSKGPNTVGTDIFNLDLYNSKVETQGDDQTVAWVISCTSKGNACTGGARNSLTRIIRDGWQINYW